MFFAYNGYTSDVGEATILVSYETLRSRRSIPYAFARTFDVRGRILRSTRTDLLSRVTALKTAFATDGGNFVWQYADTTESLESIANADTAGGVRVTQPSFDQGIPAERSTFVFYRLQVMATTFLAGASNVIVHSEERFSHRNPEATGDWDYIPLKDGKWQYQVGHEKGTHTLVQSGRIIALRSHISTPTPPVFPTTPPWKRDLNTLDGEDPQEWIGTTPILFPTAYSYTFVSNEPMTLYLRS